jgi:adenosylcobinamide kinase/adenosylcobinamide-phosphate guanylyltransferase
MTSASLIDCRAALILGGARSGKSRYAQKLAEETGLSRVFIATAEALDDEMAERIGRHRAERGPGWLTREAPLALAEALSQEARPGRIVVADCLTLWLSNLMHAGRAVETEIADLTAEIERLTGPALFVSNEVGLGIAPPTPLGREFRDAQGRLNQAVAAVCGAVVALTAGQPRLVKPAPRPALRLI